MDRRDFLLAALFAVSLRGTAAAHAYEPPGYGGDT